MNDDMKVGAKLKIYSTTKIKTSLQICSSMDRIEVKPIIDRIGFAQKQKMNKFIFK